ncbi:XRE family transcriptional regulator [Sulfurimonas sp.]|uniref:XRE family transcriptional regulator n=1 Tax=Sulfurimonas sp. TaxID=2022749 RepID=UPI003567819F
MQSLADRIRAVRKKLGMSQQELADVLGCSDGKIKGWEQGNTMTIKPRDSLFLAKKYGFSQEWLEDGKGEIMLNTGDFSLKVKNLSDAPFNNSFSIPYYKDMEHYNSDENSVNSIDISMAKDMLELISSENIEAIRVTSNSMNPTIKEGDVIFIDKDDVKASNEKIYLVLLCDEIYLKRVFIEPKSKEIILNSDNLIFPQLKADCQDFRILGKVIAKMNISKV